MKAEPEEIVLEYRFDYTMAKPNRFAEMMILDVGWTVEKSVEEQKAEKLKVSRNRKSVPKKAVIAKK